MGGATAIADVGETLVGVLRDRMGDLVDPTEIALAAPDSVESGGDLRLTLYLYEVSENPHLRNERGDDGDPDRSQAPPLTLDLHYLLTAHPAHSGADETARTAEQHSVLGRAMQVFADNAILRGSDLEGALDSDAELRISLEDESTDVIVNVWSTFEGQAYRPSVAYLVTPVRIESTREEPAERVVQENVAAYAQSGGQETDE